MRDHNRASEFAHENHSMFLGHCPAIVEILNHG